MSCQTSSVGGNHGCRRAGNRIAARKKIASEQVIRDASAAALRPGPNIGSAGYAHSLGVLACPSHVFCRCWRKFPSPDLIPFAWSSKGPCGWEGAGTNFSLNIIAQNQKPGGEAEEDNPEDLLPHPLKKSKNCWSSMSWIMLESRIDLLRDFLIDFDSLNLKSCRGKIMHSLEVLKGI